MTRAVERSVPVWHDGSPTTTLAPFPTRRRMLRLPASSPNPRPPRGPVLLGRRAAAASLGLLMALALAGRAHGGPTPADPPAADPVTNNRPPADQPADPKPPASDSSEEKPLERGAAIYQKTCAACHGDRGQGVEDAHDEPLGGTASLADLTRLITETMPEDDPTSCVGEDAQAVAAYVHRQFYRAAAAVERGKLPRIRLARLTARQLRQSLADLYAAPRRGDWPVQAHGLRGIYFQGAGWNNDHRIFERIDPVVDFDFGHDGPGQGIDPQAFYIQWHGGVRADVTGSYEFVVRSTCAFMFYLGADRRTFIDNHVQSADLTEFRRSIVLTAGHVTPIRIDLFQRKRKTEQPPATISLSWKPPHGVERLIPARSLVDTMPSPTFSLQAKLPPDDRSYGYERGIAVDRPWDASTTAAALEFADAVIAERWPAYRRRHRSDANDRRAILRRFLAEIVETALRGPLTDQLRQRYVDQPVDAEEDDAEAIRHALLLTLKSPRFLYPAFDQHCRPQRRAANRLALTLFDSLPVDTWLLKAASAEGFETEAKTRAAARRMVFDLRARAKVRGFLWDWLHLRRGDEITKDEERFAGFDAALVDQLRASLDRQLDDIVWSDASDYRQLFLADRTYTTDRLADFYGPAWQPAEAGGGGLRRSVADRRHRFGILTHPYLMSRLAYFDGTSPIHRGVFLYRYLLGRMLRPPREAFAPLAADLHPDLTTRERVELQTAPASCQMCHTNINGLGFTLENFDAVGRFREMERGKRVDPTGSYTARTGERIAIGGPRALAHLLATSPDAHRAFVHRAFQYFVKQPPAAYGADTLDKLTEHFQKNAYNIRDLVVEIAVIAARGPDAGADKVAGREGKNGLQVQSAR